MAEEEKSFKVSDRRLSVRGYEAEEEETPPPRPAPERPDPERPEHSPLDHEGHGKHGTERSLLNARPRLRPVVDMHENRAE
ncbi:MAG: hypothetical protein AABZ64_16765, partial [Nitrospinota bacterium]